MPNGNYDYIVTYQFNLYRHVRVDIGSSGYIQGHFMPPDRGEKDSMAYRVLTYTGGSRLISTSAARPTHSKRSLTSLAPLWMLSTLGELCLTPKRLSTFYLIPCAT
jgi:hypothetical protein